MAKRRNDKKLVARLVTTHYIPVPEDRLAIAEDMIADLRAGTLTGFAMIVVGPETAGGIVGFTGGRMDRIQLMGQLTISLRYLQDQELEEQSEEGA